MFADALATLGGDICYHKASLQLVNDIQRQWAKGGVPCVQCVHRVTCVFKLWAIYIHMPGSTESLSNNISQWASVGMGWCWQGMNRVRDMRAVRFMARPQQSLTIFFRRLRELLPLTKFRVSLLWRECQAVCFQFTHLPCDDWENIYTLSYHHHQIGSMSYYLLFRVRSWNNGIRCVSLYS